MRPYSIAGGARRVGGRLRAVPTATPGVHAVRAAGCLLPGAFYPGAVFVPALAMIVLQFLCLWLAGRALFREKGREADAR